MFAGAMKRLRVLANPENIRWAQADILCKVAKGKDERGWKELEFLGLAGISFTNLVQVREAWFLGRWEDGGIKFEWREKEGFVAWQRF